MTKDEIDPDCIPFLYEHEFCKLRINFPETKTIRFIEIRWFGIHRAESFQIEFNLTDDSRSYKLELNEKDFKIRNKNKDAISEWSGRHHSDDQAPLPYADSITIKLLKGHKEWLSN